MVEVAVIAEETVVVAAVVSGPAVWVHHVWSAHRGRPLQSSSASLASLALRVMPYVTASFAHLIAVARCDTQTFSSFNSDDPSWSKPVGEVKAFRVSSLSSAARAAQVVCHALRVEELREQLEVEEEDGDRQEEEEEVERE